MRVYRRFVLIFLLCLSLFATAQNADWTTQIHPFQIADNLYYVGSRDLAAFLVSTPAGNILINANLETSPPQIHDSVERLGFRWRDTKIILNGQAHFDHLAGAAQIMRETGAKNYVMDGDADVSESGGRTDFAFGPKQQFPPAHVDRVLHDGDTVELGGVVLTAHRTAGHTRGCTTWTLRVHLLNDVKTKLRDVVIVGGITTLDYRLVDKPGKPASYPGIASDFAQTFRTLRALPCDIFLGAHGSYFNMLEKLHEMHNGRGEQVWIDPVGYKEAVDAAQRKFEKELAKQKDS